ncbi:MAG: biotin/lipoyl-containing protein [Planctomycetota bacterium]
MSVRRDFVRDGEKFTVSADHFEGATRVRLAEVEQVVTAECTHDGKVVFTLDGQRHTATVARSKDAVIVRIDGRTFELPLHRGGRGGTEAGSGDLVAPMTGTVLDVRSEVGARVQKGDTLAIVSAMKMEHKLTAAFDGEVTDVGAKAGDQVDQGALIVRVSADEGADA